MIRFCALLLVLQGLLLTPVYGTVSDEAKGLAAANEEFAWSLYDTVSELAEGGNMFFSPLSVSLALGMTYAGAKGDTKSQMSKVLGFDVAASDNALNRAFQELIDAFNQDQKNYTLDIANRLFGKEGYNFLQEYKSVTNTYFRAGLQELDFAGDPEGSRVHINSWVEDNTNDKIKDLLPVGSINGGTALVLVNAIYFKAAWLLPFDPLITGKGPFYGVNDQVFDMDLMHISKYFKYAEVPSLDSQVLELPYLLREVSMFIILPKERQGLAAVEEKLVDFDFSEMENSLPSKMVHVTLPKFKMTQNVNLKAILMEMGMEDLFLPSKCDLSGISGNKDLVVSEVTHKTFINLNEEGTEAAGATVIRMVGSAPDPDRITFTADHPFVFYIKEKATGSVLFTGRLTTSPDSTKGIGAFGQDFNAAGFAYVPTWITCLFTTALVMFLRTGLLT